MNKEQRLFRRSKKHYYTLDVVYTAMETLDDVEQIKSKK